MPPDDVTKNAEPPQMFGPAKRYMSHGSGDLRHGEQTREDIEPMTQSEAKSMPLRELPSSVSRSSVLEHLKKRVLDSKTENNET